MYHNNKENVYIEWDKSKHIKNKRQLVNFVDSSNFFRNAVASQKPIAAFVYSIVKNKNFAIHTYKLHLSIGTLNEHERQVHNPCYYWRMRGEQPQMHMYSSLPFAPISITIPCTSFADATHEHATQAPPENCKGPRVSLHPPYGTQYIYGLDKTVNVFDIAEYSTVIADTASEIYKLFVDENGEVV